MLTLPIVPSQPARVRKGPQLDYLLVWSAESLFLRLVLNVQNISDRIPDVREV